MSRAERVALRRSVKSKKCDTRPQYVDMSCLHPFMEKGGGAGPAILLNKSD